MNKTSSLSLMCLAASVAATPAFASPLLQQSNSALELITPRFEPVSGANVFLNQGTSFHQATTLDGRARFNGTELGAGGTLTVHPTNVPGGKTLGQILAAPAVAVGQAPIGAGDMVINEWWTTVPALYHATIASSLGDVYGDAYMTWGICPVGGPATPADEGYDFLAMAGTLNSPRAIEAYLAYNGVTVSGQAGFERATLFRTRGESFGEGAGAYLSTFLDGSAAYLVNQNIDLTIVHVAPNLATMGTCSVTGSYVTHSLAAGAMHQLDGNLGVGDTLFIYSPGSGVVHGPISTVRAIQQTPAFPSTGAASSAACTDCSACNVPWSSANLVCGWTILDENDPQCANFSAAYTDYSERSDGCIDVGSMCWDANAVPNESPTLEQGSAYEIDTSVDFAFESPVGGSSFNIHCGETYTETTTIKYPGVGTPSAGANNCGQCMSWVRRTMEQVAVRHYWRGGRWLDLFPGCKRTKKDQRCYYRGPVTLALCDRY